MTYSLSDRSNVDCLKKCTESTLFKVTELFSDCGKIVRFLHMLVIVCAILVLRLMMMFTEYLAMNVHTLNAHGMSVTKPC